MNTQHISSFPAPEAGTLFAFFLSRANLKSSTRAVEEAMGEKGLVQESYTEEEARNFFFSGEKKAIFLGLGEGPAEAEVLRQAVHAAVRQANDLKLSQLVLHYVDKTGKNKAQLVSLTEAAVLSNYQFLVYKTDAEKKKNSLTEVSVWSSDRGAASEVEKGAVIARATSVARDLVNEPVITLTAEELANRAKKLGDEFGFSVEVFTKSKIKTLKMGGVLAVNYGSPNPPTFTIMEHKPEKPKNSQPIILVGKGIVYDTGGLSLKPTANSMDFMKSDMAGSAVVIGAMCGLAALKSDYHVIGLVPATDNRPGQNAVTPGDVITMFDGTTVEVLNTDAEGRLVLADALAYAKKYKPALVMDFATLTGAAVVAVGRQGIALMSTADDKTKDKLKASGHAVHERLVELPLWKEYREQLKSDIADLKNIGGREAGTITAGKFLEHFTDYPWAHFDIAGVAFLHGADSYRGKNGTGSGVRLMLDFIQNSGI